MKTNNVFVSLLVSGILFFSTVCAQETSGNLPPGVVATQGGVQVTLQDIDAYAQRIPEADRAGYFDSPTRIQNAIMSLLLNKQLAAEARAAKLEQHPLAQLEMQQAADEALARNAINHYRAT